MATLAFPDLGRLGPMQARNKAISLESVKNFIASYTRQSTESTQIMPFSEVPPWKEIIPGVYEQSSKTSLQTLRRKCV